MALPKTKAKANLVATVKNYVAVRDQIKALEDTLAVLKEELLNAAASAGGQIDTPTHTVKVVEQERKTLQKDRLIELGVTPKILDKATVITAVTFVRVDAKKVDVK